MPNFSDIGSLERNTEERFKNTVKRVLNLNEETSGVSVGSNETDIHPDDLADILDVFFSEKGIEP